MREGERVACCVLRDEKDPSISVKITLICGDFDDCRARTVRRVWLIVPRRLGATRIIRTLDAECWMLEAARIRSSKSKFSPRGASRPPAPSMRRTGTVE